MPAEAYCSSPGFSLASAISSLTEFTGSVGIDHQHVRAGGEDGDRRERLDRIVGQLVEPRIDRVRERDDQQRVAVLRRIGRDLGADDAAGAGAAVVDDHLLAEPLAEMRWRSARPTTSLLPPGGNGMISRTGLVG